MSTFTRMVELGRIVHIIHGPHAGKSAVIVNILDHNRIFVDGPEVMTGVPRHVTHTKWITLSGIVVSQVTPNMTTHKLCERYTRQNIKKRLEKTPTSLAIKRKQLRSTLTDFDRFRANIYMTKLMRTARNSAYVGLKKAKK